MNKLFRRFNIRSEQEDFAVIHNVMESGIAFKGTNLWILIFAIFIASVGLNVNSTAVIIGAMLISPLMGPIIGMGYSLATYDFLLLKKAASNFGFAVISGLVTSTLYFLVTPINEAHSELLARTQPNIYDVLIALFGGLAGIIAMSSKTKGNVIPGVAIATALMPPLCTAGYGLATANWAYFLGAFYLYCINCVFIGIATFAIIKFLKYPAKKMVNPTQQKRVRQVITWLTIIMLLPSSYLAYNLYREQEFRKRTEQFLDREFTQKGDVIVYRKTYVGKKPKRVELAFLSQRFEPEEIAALNAKLEKAVEERVELVIRQDSTDRLTALKGDIMNEIKHTTLLNTSKDVKIASLQQQITSNTFETKQILSEAEALFPTIAAMSIANHSFTQANDSTFAETVVIIDINGAFSNTERSRFSNWLTKRLAVKKISVYTR